MRQVYRVVNLRGVGSVCGVLSAWDCLHDGMVEWETVG